MKIFSFTLILAALAMGSCKKYLELKPNKKLLTNPTVEQVQGLLDHNDRMNRGVGADELSADDYYLTTDAYNALTYLPGKAAYLWEEELMFDIFPNDWTTSYDAIYYANTALELLEKIPRNNLNAVAYDNAKGGALFFRSRWFLENVITWAKAYDRNTAASDLGIPLRLNSDFNEPSVRASVKEVYERIIADMEQAARLLPVTPDHVMRPSRPAAYAILSRTYLAMREYDKAGKYADSCLQLKSTLIDYNTLNSAANFPISMFNSEVIMHYNHGSLAQMSRTTDSNLYRSYAANDLRKTIFFRSNGDGTYGFKGHYTGSATHLGGPATDEMYLTRAECFARAGNTTAALNDLNALLVKRHKSGTFVPVTAQSSQDALNKILVERRKELMLRGLRWMDIKRLNKEGANISIKRIINNTVYELPPNDPRFALPLPGYIVALTGMPQNPR
jgi:tetratricopeptide (TPR) repeat protein